MPVHIHDRTLMHAFICVLILTLTLSTRTSLTLTVFTVTRTAKAHDGPSVLCLRRQGRQLQTQPRSRP